MLTTRVGGCLPLALDCCEAWPLDLLVSLADVERLGAWAVSANGLNGSDNCLKVAHADGVLVGVLLAWRMTLAGEAGATRVRVVHIAPADNDGYLQSLNRESQRAVGDDVLAVWRQLLRHPDDFISVDSARFTDCIRDLAGPDFCDRYGDR